MASLIFSAKGNFSSRRQHFCKVFAFEKYMRSLYQDADKKNGGSLVCRKKYNDKRYIFNCGIILVFVSVLLGSRPGLMAGAQGKTRFREMKGRFLAGKKYPEVGWPEKNHHSSLDFDR